MREQFKLLDLTWNNTRTKKQRYRLRTEFCSRKEIFKTQKNEDYKPNIARILHENIEKHTRTEFVYRATYGLYFSLCGAVSFDFLRCLDCKELNLSVS